VIVAGAFLFGLIIGSFLNVCILRIPNDESVVAPPSHCPACGAGIKPYDNIPVVSWLLLRGRCRKCKARISPQYPAVELLTGLLFVACYLMFGWSFEALKWAVFAALLVVLTVTDLRERILPDVVNFTGLGLGLLLSLFTAPVDGTAGWIAGRLFGSSLPQPALSLADALIGAAAASGLLWIVAEGYFRLRGREGMGLGDVKMMAMAGAFLGLQRALLTILLGSLLGTVVGSITILCLFIFGYKRAVADRAARMGLGSATSIRFVLARRYQLPFGTYLGAGGMATVFFGSTTLAWYRSFLALP
jgi:leader peptidase (prepilin peptidase)/N-methyltransferase